MDPSVEQVIHQKASKELIDAYEQHHSYYSVSGVNEYVYFKHDQELKDIYLIMDKREYFKNYDFDHLKRLDQNGNGGGIFVTMKDIFFEEFPDISDQIKLEEYVCDTFDAELFPVASMVYKREGLSYYFNLPEN